ncbi:MAG: DNA/RNA non-specific endonuclease [Alistipes sp.]|nr:DNA/RNA non-specific endonuclease [Alistipes sp.]
MSSLLIPFWLQHLPIVVGLTACLAGSGKGNGVDTDTSPAVQSGSNATETQFDARSAAWPELPLRIENEDYTYTTHYCTVRNQRDSCDFNGRNYTMCFDRTKRGAWWVAYPLHETYFSTGRPKRDPWAYDPAFSSAWQADISHGSYVGGYDRGHQIPNADRNADLSPGGMCYQTFYASNSTPQASVLNQRSWARLEAKVRSWVCADTLYVVTGAYWCPDCVQTTDKGGNVCAVPDYYFKVVVRTVAGDIRQEGDYLGRFAPAQLKSIGFWAANVGQQSELKTWVRSVAEIEAATGFTFFPTLPESVKQQKEASSWGL